MATNPGGLGGLHRLFEKIPSMGVYVTGQCVRSAQPALADLDPLICGQFVVVVEELTGTNQLIDLIDFKNSVSDQDNLKAVEELK
ncbi:hypothetical protein Q1695_013341 [Nippostrongylus brasiliensis]|nr:hypothetical protein Q1695_013341 [Nippostrongylus brasiliensis]